MKRRFFGLSFLLFFLDCRSIAAIFWQSASYVFIFILPPLTQFEFHALYGSIIPLKDDCCLIVAGLVSCCHPFVLLPPSNFCSGICF